MVGVDKNRKGGMWSVAENYILSNTYNERVNLTYIATSTGGTIIRRVFKMLKGIIQVYYTLKTKKVDVVHIHMAEKGSVYRKGIVIRMARRAGKKVVVQMHAGPIMSWYKSLDVKHQRRVKKIFDNCDLMLVLGEYWRNEIKQLISDSKIRVLYNGVVIQKSNEYSLNNKNILFLGMVTRRKGAFDLIDAIKKIDTEIDSDIRVVFGGIDGNNELEKYSEKLGLSSRIIFKGWIGEEEKRQCYKNAMICALPSYFEGLSMTIIEAMSYGVPVVTTNISTMREIVGDDYNLINPGDVDSLADSLLYLIKNESNRQAISSYLYDRANKNFGLEHNIEKTIEYYKEVISI